MSVTIGIDPHKSTHTAVAVDRDERTLARLTLPANGRSDGPLVGVGEPFGDAQPPKFDLRSARRSRGLRRPHTSVATATIADCGRPRLRPGRTHCPHQAN
jgi:hypothetical protein